MAYDIGYMVIWIILFFVIWQILSWIFYKFKFKKHWWIVLLIVGITYFGYSYAGNIDFGNLKTSIQKTDNIKDINENPKLYLNQEITVKGEYQNFNIGIGGGPELYIKDEQGYYILVLVDDTNRIFNPQERYEVKGILKERDSPFDNSYSWDCVSSEGCKQELYLVNRTFYAYYNDSSNKIKSGCFKIQKINLNFSSFVYDECVSGSSGSFVYTVDNSSSVFTSTLTYTINPNKQIYIEAIDIIKI